ncbi:MAG: glycerophosphodiester phosphodiesterase family protein, partial [Candidatus Tectomicrobia bacterium]|nr:glycerophosphodiester phosphodiesterase family protein [Candidatus Tectomicrobia bacterium]
MCIESKYKENAYIKKLLSHRLLRFSKFENTLSALDIACSSAVPYLEIDARVSKDGKIYLYHDHQTGSDMIDSCILARSSSAEVDRLRFTNGEPLLSLEEALKRFQKRTFKSQSLCIDIKDYGFEEQFIDLVRGADLENSVYFVSWIPQTLIRLNELGVKSPLILSHWNLLEWGKFGYFLTSIVAQQTVNLKHYVLIGRNDIDATLGSLSHGYQHTLICQEIPDRLLTILSASFGGICVHYSMMGETLASYCFQHCLKLW